MTGAGIGTKVKRLLERIFSATAALREMKGFGSDEKNRSLADQ